MIYVAVCLCFAMLGFALAVALDLFERDRLRASRDRVEKQSQRYLDELVPLRDEARRLHALALALEGERNEARRQRDLSRDDLRVALAKRDQLIIEVCSERDAAARERDEARQRCQSLEEIAAEMTARAEAYRQAANLHCERAQALMSERDTAREIAEEVIAERNAFREQVQAVEDDNGRLRAQRDELSRLLDESRCQLAEREEQRDEARALAADAENARRAASEENVALCTAVGRERCRAAKVANELVNIAEGLQRRPE